VAGKRSDAQGRRRSVAAKGTKKKRQGVTYRQFAAMMGVSEPAVVYAVRDGRIPTFPDGSLDPIVARSAWLANTDLTKPRNAVTGAPKRRRSPDGTPAPALAADGDGGGGAGGARKYASFRAAHEGIRAKISELELRRLLGELIETRKAASEAFTVYRRLRDQFLSIPPRLAPLVRTMKDADEIENAMAKEIHQVLDEVASWKPSQRK